jgi:hypothetical protein
MRASLIWVLLIVAGGCKDKGKEAPVETRAPEPVVGEAPDRGGWEPMALGRSNPEVNPVKGVAALTRGCGGALKKGDVALARQKLDAALGMEPESVTVLGLGAKVSLAEGDIEGALSFVERVAAVDHVAFRKDVLGAKWLGPLEEDGERWKELERRAEAYRDAWADALAGPGAFFVRGCFSKLEQVGIDGEKVDLTFSRGMVMFWSASSGRYLPLGQERDVAGYIVDVGKLYVVRWSPDEEARPGAMGRVVVSRIDLDTMVEDAKPVEVAEWATTVRLAIDDEGVLVGVEAAVVDLDAGTEPPEAPMELFRVDWDEGRAAPVVERAEEPDEDWDDDDEEGPPEWRLTVALGETEALRLAPPASHPVELEARRGGSCVVIDWKRALCFIPTKLGGRFLDLELREQGKDPVKLNADYFPVVQY